MPVEMPLGMGTGRVSFLASVTRPRYLLHFGAVPHVRCAERDLVAWMVSDVEGKLFTFLQSPLQCAE